MEYTALLSVGGSVEIEGEGLRGIIIYRQSESKYLAFERNCSYRPSSACADVRLDASKLFMVDSCCGSTFDFEGYPIGGPAAYPLLTYPTYLSGSLLYVSN